MPNHENRASHGMPSQQRGAALVFSLVILSATLLLGVSGYDGSNAGESVAGNYRAATQARLTVEQAASEAMESIEIHREALGASAALFINANDLEALAQAKGKTLDTVGLSDVWLSETVEEAADDSTLRQVRRYAYLGDSALEQLAANAGLGVGSDVEPGQYLLAEGAVVVGDREVRRQILVQYKSIIEPGYLEAVFMCFGDDCSHDAAGHVSSEDHGLPEDFQCKGSACHTNPNDGDGIDEFCFVAETDSEAYATKRLIWLNVLEDIEQLPDYEKIVYDGSGQKGGGKVDEEGDRINPYIIVIDGDVDWKKNGNASTSGIIVVKNGATLRLNGTAHHEGLIIVEEGGRLLSNNGNYTLHGGIIIMKGGSGVDASGNSNGNGNGNSGGGGGGNAGNLDNACGDDEMVTPGRGDKDSIDIVFGGNSDIQYSLEALINLKRIEGKYMKEIVSWREL